MMRLDSGFSDRAEALRRDRHRQALIADLQGAGLGAMAAYDRAAFDSWFNTEWAQAAAYIQPHDPFSLECHMLILMTQDVWGANPLHHGYAAAMNGHASPDRRLEDGIRAVWHALVRPRLPPTLRDAMDRRAGRAAADVVASRPAVAVLPPARFA